MGREYKPHVVKQGEHGAALAFLSGADPAEIWDHAENAELKKKRSSMDVLCPGDVIFLPDGPREGATVSKGATNRFTANVPKRTLTVTLATQDGPIAGEPYEIHGMPSHAGTPPPTGTTGGSGEVTLHLPVTTKEVTIYLPGLHRSFAFLVGGMDPVEEPTGVAKRLENLGILPAGTPHEGIDLSEAIAEFQKKNGLPVTGGLDKATLDKLVQLAGT